jgi:hypothetical protein
MKRLLLTALTAVSLAQPASAQLYYEGIPGPVEFMNFMAGSGVSGGYGVQVGPYTAQFIAPYESPASAPFSIYCVDYLHFAKDGLVNVTAMDEPDLSNTRLDDYDDYRQAAYLASLFHDPAYTQTQWGGIHAAIWKITSGQILGTGATATLRDQLLAMAVPGDFSTAGWYILSPSPLVQLQYGKDKSGQEFLMRTRVSVPEPATFLLLATGLLFLAATSRKRLIGLREGDA